MSPLVWVLAYVVLSALPAVALLFVVLKTPGLLPNRDSTPYVILFGFSLFPLLLLWPLRYQLKAPEFFAVFPTWEMIRTALGTAMALLMCCEGLFWLCFYPLTLWFPEAAQRWLLRSPPILAHSEAVILFARIAAFGIVAPIVEEVVFRGILFRRWASTLGSVRGLVLSSAMFALFHIDPPGAFVFAVVVSLLYAKTGTLYVPVVVHAIYNLGSLAADYALLSATGRPWNPAYLSEFWYFYIAALLIGSLWGLRMLRGLWSSQAIAAA